MNVLTNPFFWAFLSMTALVGACGLVRATRLRSPLVGLLIVLTLEAGRIILALPCCPQPRFTLPGATWLGALMLGVALIFGLAAPGIKPLTHPEPNMRLRTTGLYGLVRHPRLLL